MLNYRNWISSKTLLGFTSTELLKNRRRRVVGWLTIISAFENVLIFNSCSAPFSLPFLFFPLYHPFADSFLPLRTCPCSEKEQEGIRKQLSLCLPQVREESGKELLLSYSLARWNVHKAGILSSKLETLKSGRLVEGAPGGKKKRNVGFLSTFPCFTATNKVSISFL